MYFVGHLEEVCGIEYREGGVVTDPFQSLANHGATIARAALHLEPYGNHYTNTRPDPDWGSPARVEETLVRAQNAGLASFLTIGYDSYADTQKNNPYAAPPRWRWMASNEALLADTLYAYTYRQLERLEGAGVIPRFVAVGNEINWRFMEPNVPESQLSDFDAARKVRLLNSAVSAVRDFATERSAEIDVVMHIFSASNITWWVNTHAGLDYDVLGLSFYHGWHSMGSFRTWAAVVNWLEARDLDFMLLESAQLWSSGYSDLRVNILNAGENIPAGYPNPPTTQTQRQYTADVTAEILEAGGLGTIYWGGDWVGSDCYVYPDEYGRGSSWEDKAFWDFEGNLHGGVDWMADVAVSVEASPSPDQERPVLYPQPAAGSARLSRLAPDVRRITVWTVDGRRILSLPRSEFLDLGHLAAGLYFVRLERDSGRTDTLPLMIAQ